MWCIIERKQDHVIRIIGPFETVQLAAKWVDEKYTRPLMTTATIEQMVFPTDAAKPNG